MVQCFTNNQFFCSTIIFVLLSMLGPCCILSCLILYIYIYNWIIPKDGNMFPGWLRMIFASWLQVCNFYFMCFVFGSWSFRSRIWSVDDYGDDDDDDVVAMWQCGTQNEGPRKKSLQLSTAEHWEPVGFQEKRAARNSGIGGCGQQGLCDLLANARSARRLILFLTAVELSKWIWLWVPWSFWGV